MVYCLIPLAAGQVIDERVLDGIRNQSIPLSPIICIAKGVIDSQGNYCMERVRGEIQSRDLQVQNAKKLKGEYILSIDRDIVLTDYGAVQTMVDCLQENRELGAVGLWFERGRKVTVWLPHIYFKCILFRREVFSKLDFTKHDVRSCSYKTKIYDNPNKSDLVFGYYVGIGYAFELKKTNKTVINLK